MPTDACCVPSAVATDNESGHHSTEREGYQAVLNAAESVVSARAISLRGGWFKMGADDAPHPQDGEGPIRDVWVDPFSIAPTTVTNQDFAHFVEQTGYVTRAETLGYSYVFHLFNTSGTATLESPEHIPWWHAVVGACWHLPRGAGLSIEPIKNHPVVHIAWSDAQAYCLWANARLPTEAEWEYAARAGLVSQPYPWGHELEPDAKHRSNVWQGEFPANNTALDGYVGTAPTRAFDANDFGLYNMTGNVWEWCQDRFTTLHSPRATVNPAGPLNGEKRVVKGGSYLCHESYCMRYRNSSRQALSPDSTADNVGFRIAGKHLVNTR